MEYINHYVDLVMLATFITFAVLGAVGFYLLKIKKVMAKEEKINYASFNRVDASEYVKFDNIISCKSAFDENRYGVIIVNKYTFIAILDVKGYNFASASNEERDRTMINSIVFFNTVERPIQMRQSVKAIDISYNINKQINICKKLEVELMELSEEYFDTVQLADSYKNDQEAYNTIEKQILKLQTDISSLKWKIKEANEMLEYMKRITSNSNAKKINQLVFSYTYNPNEYTEELSDEEVYLKASSEIGVMANNYANSLGNCGCSCRLLTGMEILDLIHRHNHPYTADDIRIEDLYNSSYNSLFISTDSLEMILRKRLGNAGFEKKRDSFIQTAKDRTNIKVKESEKLKEDLEKLLMTSPTN